MPASSAQSRSPQPNGNGIANASIAQSIPSGYDFVSDAEHQGQTKDDEKRDVKDRMKVALGLKSKGSPILNWGNTLKPRIKALDEYPDGYSKLAAFQGADPNFLIFRKHGWLRNRLLCYYQDKLAELEEDLERIDSFDYATDPKRLMSRRLDNGTKITRIELFKEIEDTLRIYDELLLKTQKINSIRQPSRRNQQSVYNFIHNTGAQVGLESEWIQLSDDLAALSTDGEHGWVNGFLEDLFRHISRTLTLAIFRTEDQKWRAGKEDLMLVSQQRFNNLIAFCITILATVLLLVPVYLLAEVVEKDKRQILVIFGFTLLFAFCSAVFTKARRHEVFAAAAAYCAVLVVFLGNTNSNPQIIYMLANGTVLNSTAQRS